MTRTATVSPFLAKEIRALLPLWAGSVIALTAASVWQAGNLAGIGLLTFIVGSLAIGAQSIGQEYTYRTLPMLLSQPADRRRVYLVKFVVSAVMLLTLAAWAGALFGDVWFEQSRQVSGVVLPLLMGLFLAPLFTMIARGPLAGMVLSLIVPGMTWTAATAVAWFGFGTEPGRVEQVVFDRWAAGALVLCPLLGILGWRRFAALEAGDADPPALHLPRWLKRADGVRRHAPLRALAAKEVHLQQLTFAVAGLYLVSWAVAALVQRYVPSMSSFPLGAVMLLYCLGLAILIGSIASADERQLLQPAPAWQQWMVKVGAAVVLAVVLCVGMPAVLIQTTPLQDMAVVWQDLAVMVVPLTAGSLYVSSLSSSGTRAMVWSLPIGIAVVRLIDAVMPESVSPGDVMLLAARGFTFTLVPLLLWFGFVNHTSAEGSVRRLLVQLVAVAVVIVAGIVLAGSTFAG